MTFDSVDAVARLLDPILGHLRPLQYRIINHWTAGTYSPSPLELSCYHLLITWDPKTKKAGIRQGINPISRPAPHTGGYNSAIGVSVCSMAGYQSTSSPGPYPILQEQWDVLVRVNAYLSQKYLIPITEATILMHGEVETVLGEWQAGRWDIGWLPWKQNLVGASSAGRILRLEVREELDRRPPVLVTAHREESTYPALQGIVWDGSTWVPLRQAITSWYGSTYSITPDASWDRVRLSTTEGGAGVTAYLPLLKVQGVGYVHLRELMNYLSEDPSTISVDKWSGGEREVSVRLK